MNSPDTKKKTRPLRGEVLQPFQGQCDPERKGSLTGGKILFIRTKLEGFVNVFNHGVPSMRKSVK
jgi:hypothetical protein